MEKKEILKKIENMTAKSKRYEIFVQPRPPEEFGDGVKLSFNEEDQTYTAEVFDPDTKEVFTKKNLSHAEHAYSFISNILEPQVEHQNEQKDYIDLDITEPGK
ncbi:hypothetical protein [Halalkalibacter okhensis]|uniref:Uncharacterized protein n=1 Tax=Halalkalibacter okhensis TaxID=333138 RepID=A0A0B0ICH9_9BACI|nr:hypothetical protein [Halalkalibacter okhensis]KHF37759.1 hypothetical protein LQ50_25525 [Halalkalibacter okhensis]